MVTIGATYFDLVGKPFRIKRQDHQQLILAPYEGVLTVPTMSWDMWDKVSNTKAFTSRQMHVDRFLLLLELRSQNPYAAYMRSLTEVLWSK
jgi:hypothetical protein